MIDKECPFYHAEKGGIAVCKASVSERIPYDLEQKTLCATEDYDLCPTFLGHALRINSITLRFAGRMT